MKKRVLHIAQSAGGVSEYLKYFFKYSDVENYEIYFACSNYYEDDIDIFNKLIKNVNMIQMEREINLLSDYRSYRKLLDYARKIKPDIIHAHSSKAGVYARLIGKKINVPVVYNSHGWSFTMDVSYIKKYIYGFIEKYLSIFTKKIINISESEQHSAMKYIDIRKMTIIRNGIDLEKYDKAFDIKKIKEQYGIEKDALIIGMVARLSAQKDPDLFVDIAKYISNRINKKVHFIIVGDGELCNHIEARFKNENLNYTITGWINNVPEIISIFDIALLTSKWEGFGLVIAEYMASAKPVVASEVGGIKEIIKNNENGFLINSRNPSDYGEKIITLIKDEKIKNKFINKSLKIVKEKYDIKRVVREHENLYSSIISKKIGE